MSGFLFAFLCAVLAGIGARDQRLVAQLSARLGSHFGLLIAALVTAVATSAVAAWAATVLSAEVAGPARLVFAAMALGIAGIEALLLSARKAPAEPTRSLFAAALVLLAQQATDAVRFVILALALLTAAPISAGMGGATGSAALLAAAWAFPELATANRLRTLRRIAGGVLLIAALALVWRVFS
ncbi:MAG: hypothetical protein ABIQ66_02720 [Novosphingobium sp.]